LEVLGGTVSLLIDIANNKFNQGKANFAKFAFDWRGFKVLVKMFVGIY